MKRELNETRTQMQGEINDLMDKNAAHTVEIHDTKMQLVEQLKIVKELNEDHNLEINELKEEHNKRMVEKDLIFLEEKK